MTRQRRRTCPHCNHQIAKLGRHQPLCEKRTPEEREAQWRIIEARRRHQNGGGSKAKNGQPNVYGDLVNQLQALYPDGIPTGDSEKLLATVQWVFTTFHMLKQRAS